MPELAEMSPSEAVEFALDVLLQKGFSSKYYESWQDYGISEYEDEGVSLVARQGAWEALLEGVPKDVRFDSDTITVSWVGSRSDGLWDDSSVYFVIFRLEQNSVVRFIKHDGYYTSYSGGVLHEGAISSEVYPTQKTVTVWNRKELH